MTTLNEFIAGPLRAEIGDAEAARRFLEEMTRAGLDHHPDDDPAECCFVTATAAAMTPAGFALLRARMDECAGVLGDIYLEAMRAHVRVHGAASAFFEAVGEETAAEGGGDRLTGKG